ncbi:hypothetical protein [Arcobacter sp. CECT 8985]|uniref:hypothetical protein n=1 Tax=Arcobacter sp. CECT 8985 TaxID=1935424 RepID=UPI00100B5D3D|nr:hypothetical protein [Arcobacter sp. CECT 8985]RXJ87316.1 hypothetical protein CRU93_04250 [Arcobacter sp. CECT 8985]
MLEQTARILGGSIIGLVIDGVKASSKDMEKAKNLDVLREESLKQEIKMEFSKHQARVAQELAIAKRIENALEVEIEEYYDNSGKGEGGVKVDLATQSGGLGMSTENRKVSKRVYRFKGKSDTEDFEEIVDNQD